MNELKIVLVTVVVLFANTIFVVQANEDLVSESAQGAKVYFIEPQDGATVSQTFTVKFGLSGMGVAPAGVDRKHTGHHHVLINMDELPEMGQPLPATENIIHFGGGQTEAELTLPPGKHTLQLLLGNHIHVPHDQPVISDKISITVIEADDIY